MCCSIVSFVYLEESRIEEHVRIKFRIKLGKCHGNFQHAESSFGKQMVGITQVLLSVEVV
jgi:hypothetical protein